MGVWRFGGAASTRRGGDPTRPSSSALIFSRIALSLALAVRFIGLFGQRIDQGLSSRGKADFLPSAPILFHDEPFGLEIAKMLVHRGEGQLEFPGDRIAVAGSLREHPQDVDLRPSKETHRGAIEWKWGSGEKLYIGKSRCIVDGY